MIGALTQLKIHLRLLFRRLKIERQGVGLADTARTGENLSRRQKSKERPKDRRSELRLASHQIILMATKRGTGVMIDVVFDERDVTGRAQGDERRLE